MTQHADYKVIADGFMRKARTLTQFFKLEYQVTDDDSDANRGGKYFMILKPGALPIAPVPNLPTKKIYNVNWNIIFDIQLRYKDYKHSWSDFSQMRDAIINLYVITDDKSLPGSELGSTIPGIWDIAITAPEPPGQKPPGGAPTWIGQQMTAAILQRIDVTR